MRTQSGRSSQAAPTSGWWVMLGVQLGPPLSALHSHKVVAGFQERDVPRTSVRGIHRGVAKIRLT